MEVKDATDLVLRWEEESRIDMYASIHTYIHTMSLNDLTVSVTRLRKHTEGVVSGWRDGSVSTPLQQRATKVKGKSYKIFQIERTWIEVCHFLLRLSVNRIDKIKGLACLACLVWLVKMWQMNAAVRY